MPWTKFALAVFAGGVISSMTDWLFMGDLLYKRFDKHPEIWRVRGGSGETSAIAWSSALSFLTCAVFAFLCVRLHLMSYQASLGFAVAISLAVALPMLVANAIWMKISTPIAASYSMGWLLKLVIAAATVVAIVS